MAAANSARILLAAWQPWVERERANPRNDAKTFGDDLLSTWAAQAKRAATLMAEESKKQVAARNDQAKRGHAATTGIDPIAAPSEGTILGWFGQKTVGRESPTHLVQKRNRSAVEWLLFHQDRGSSLKSQLWEAWCEDDKAGRPNARRARPTEPAAPDDAATETAIGDERQEPMPAGRWMPDVAAPDPNVPSSGNQGRLVEFTIHPSLESDPPNKPTVLASLSAGWINGCLDATDKSPEVFYRLTVTRLEVQPEHPHAVRIPNTGRLPFGTRWPFARKPDDNVPFLQCERLEQVEALRWAPLDFTVFCPRYGLKSKVIRHPPGCSDTDLRVLERILELWGLDPASPEVVLAKGRLLPPKQGK